MTVLEYLDWDLETESCASFIDGEVFPAEASTWDHGMIEMNLGAALRTRLSSDCTPMGSSLRVEVSPTKFVYPDMLVVCGKPVFADARTDTIVNPKLIVEVLSPSTAGYDYNEKFSYYRNLATFEEYVLISQAEPRVDVFLRAGLGKWELTPYQGLDATVTLRSLGVEIPMAEIYQRVL